MKNRNKIEKSKQKNPKKMKNRKNPKIKLKIEKKENILRFEKNPTIPDIMANHTTIICQVGISTGGVINIFIGSEFYKIK